MPHQTLPSVQLLYAVAPLGGVGPAGSGTPILAKIMAPFLLANFLATLYFVFYLLGGGFAPRIGTVQNTPAPPKFLTLPQVIPTSIPIPI